MRAPTKRSEDGGALFAIIVQNFIVCRRYRDTSLIGATNLSPVTKLLAFTCAAKAVKFISKAVIYHGAEILLRRREGKI